MSTYVAAPTAEVRPGSAAILLRYREHFAALFGTLLVLLIHGYHPYSSDGSIYIAGIRTALSPSLYAGDQAFVAAHAQLSIFSTVAARAISLLHIPVDLFLFLSYLLLTALTLLLAARLGRRLWGAERAGWGALTLMAICYPMPVAATSLLLADPYLTARSVSTPLTLLALLAAAAPAVPRSRSMGMAALYSLLAALFHPLMGVYLLLFLSVYFLMGVGSGSGRWRMIGALCLGVFAVSMALHFGKVGLGDSAAYCEAVASRDYYFLSHWKWYELLGLAAPLGLLALAGRRSNTPVGRLALTCVIVGGTCALTSLCFVHPAQTDLLMRLQLLRSFHTIYLLGTILLGSMLAVSAPRWSRLPLVGVLAAVAVGMYLNERETYWPVSHIEAPEAIAPGASGVADSWQKAFLWVRGATPAEAVFAIDPQFLRAQGESMPGFRALAERSILTDVKDEGLASLFPRIAPAWAERRDREAGLNGMSDAARQIRLAPAGVTWVLLSPSAATTLACPFRDHAVQVCALGSLPK